LAEIHPVDVTCIQEHKHTERQVDRRVHMTKLIDAFLCYANAPKNHSYIHVSMNVLNIQCSRS